MIRLMIYSESKKKKHDQFETQRCFHFNIGDTLLQILVDLPLTVSLVEHSALPIEFSATTLYSPVSLDPTLNISREQTPQVLEMK